MSEQPSTVQWPSPLGPDEATRVLAAWARTERRVDDRPLDGDVATRDASLAVLTLESLAEERSTRTVRVDAVAFPHPTIARLPVEDLAVAPPVDMHDHEQSFVFADSVRFGRDEACHGRGEVDCTSCAGTGDVPCPRFEPCPACATDPAPAGRGRRGSSACTVCLGNRRRPCSTCGGTGRTTCPGCHGRRRFTCARCSGRGDLLVGEVATVTWTRRTATVEVGELPASRRRRTVTGRRWTVDGLAVPAGLPPHVAEAAASLLVPRPDEVAHRLRVDVLPVTAVTARDGPHELRAAVVGDDHEVIAETTGRASGGRVVALVAAAAIALVALVVLVQLA